jgi:acetyl esterase/lipase
MGYRPLQLDLWIPHVPVPPALVVWIHGGAWLFGDRRYLPETLHPNQLFDESLAAGLAIASIDYRHSNEARFPAQLHDAKAAIRYLRAHSEELGIDAGRIGVWGESAGGHLAALVGLTGNRPELEGDLGVVGPSSAVDVVVDWYGPSDLAAMQAKSPPPEIAAMLPPELLFPEGVLVEGVDEATRVAASPVNNVGPDAPPFLLVHGTGDQVVPYAQSELLAQALTAAGVPVRLVPVEGADHIFDGYPHVDGVVRLSVEFLANALRKGAS